MNVYTKLMTPGACAKGTVVGLCVYMSVNRSLMKHNSRLVFQTMEVYEARK